MFVILLSMCFIYFFFFFFSSRRRHTRSLCDWSSDVCSSDLREALQDHLVVATPRDEPKGARADRVTGEAGAAPVDLLTRDDRGGVVCDQGKEGCERLIEVKLHREIVDDAYSRDVAGVARDEGACAGDLLDHPGPLALGGPLERVLHVGRCERAAIV